MKVKSFFVCLTGLFLFTILSPIISHALVELEILPPIQFDPHNQRISTKRLDIFRIAAGGK